MSGWGKADDKTATGTVALAAPTAVFDGAADVASDIITLTAHPFRTGDKVNYVDGGGTQVVGLVDTTDYYVTNVTTNSVQLAASLQDSLHNNPTVITLTDGVGASHALTLAFEVGSRGLITGAGGADLTAEAAVGDIITVADQSVVILSVESATAGTVENVDRSAALVAYGASAYTLSEKPTSIGSDSSISAADVFGVDNTELTAGDDNVVSVGVQEEGTGYLEAPAITFTGGGGASAAATATVSGGVVTDITVTNVGTGYTSAPDVVVGLPFITVPTTGVIIADTDNITYTAHGLVQADEVKYQDGGGAAITGLVDDTSYFVSGVGLTANDFRLATSAILAAGAVVPTATITDTAGAFGIATSDGGLAVGDRVVISGTLTGSATITGYVDGNIYDVSAVTGASPANTAFTLTDEDGTAIVTTAGTLDGLTLTGYTIIDLTGTGNNAQTFERIADVQATAVAGLGAGATAGGPAHSGWVKKTEGVGARAGRTQYEVLVALSKNGITGDAADDIAFPDA